MKRTKTKVECRISGCSFYADGFCHALSVTIGEAGQAMCDTFYLSETHVKNNKVIANVGACKVEDCQYNCNLLCNRKHITVGRKDDDFYCLSCKVREELLTCQ